MNQCPVTYCDPVRRLLGTVDGLDPVESALARAS